MAAKKKTETSVMEAPIGLPQKKVTIKFHPRPTAMVQDPKHILFGGLGPNSGKSFQLPRTSSGSYRNPFPDDATQALLERHLGYPEGGLNPQSRINNFFDSYLITLTKADTTLDLSDPNQYLFLLVAKQQKDFVAPAKKNLRDRGTTMWYIVDEEDEADEKVLLVSKRSEAWKEFGKIEDSVSKLRQILVEYRGTASLPSSANKHSWLVTEVSKIVESDAEVFVNMATDPNLPVKVDLYAAVTAGAIKREGSLYYLDDDTPMALPGDSNDVNGAIRYLHEPENSDFYATLKQRIQNAK